MEYKTRVDAEKGTQEMKITRDFDLPIDLLFRAYSDADILGEWMGTKVVKLDNKDHGAYQFETSDAQGKVVFRGNGCIHSFVPDQKIIRTFEMENAQVGVQLEFLEFEKLTEDTSRLNIHIIYRSVNDRDTMIRFGMAQGMNMAHNRLQEVAEKRKYTSS